MSVELTRIDGSRIKLKYIEEEFEWAGQHGKPFVFQDEKGAGVVAKILDEAKKQQLDRLICIINLGEIIYMTKRRFGDYKKLELLGRIGQLGLKILPAEDSLVYKAAELKTEYSISYADCFAFLNQLWKFDSMATPFVRQIFSINNYRQLSMIAEIENVLLY